MSKRRIYEDRNLTGTEAKRRHDDLVASIDSELNEAFKSVDQKRKEAASKSLRAFIDAYMVGFVLESKPSEMTYKAIAELEKALLDNRPV